MLSPFVLKQNLSASFWVAQCFRSEHATRHKKPIILSGLFDYKSYSLIIPFTSIDKD